MRWLLHFLTSAEMNCYFVFLFPVLRHIKGLTFLLNTFLQNPVGTARHGCDVAAGAECNHSKQCLWYHGMHCSMFSEVSQRQLFALPCGEHVSTLNFFKQPRRTAQSRSSQGVGQRNSSEIIVNVQDKTTRADFPIGSHHETETI